MVVATARRAARVGRRVAVGGARWTERRLTAPLQILCYHRVAEPVCDPWQLSVAPARFEQQMAHLSATCDVVRLDDALPHRRRHALSRRRRPRVAVTFDDGYLDNLRVALPILERHGVPATVFIPTGFVGEPAFWWDRLAALVLASSVRVGRLREALVEQGVLEPADAPGDDPDAFHRAVWSRLSRRAPGEIDGILDRLHATLRVPELADGRPMTESELHELAAHPLITIGAHTVHHRLLTALDATVVRQEIDAGQAQLDAWLGPSGRVLAYPHGNADGAVAAAAGAAGIEYALTTVDRSVSVADRARLLPRRHPKDVPAAEFGRWLASA